MKETLWEERNLIEPRMNLENNLTLDPKNIINETKNKSVNKECNDIGKKWKKICPNCEHEYFYSTETGLKRSIKNNRSCLNCRYFKKNKYVGMKFGSLTVINQYNSYSPCGSKIIKIDYKCDCGHIGLNKRINSIKRQKMCIKCKRKNQFKIKERGKSALNNLYKDYKKSAENRNYNFELTKDWFENMTKKICFYCGSEPKAIRKALNGRELYVYNGIDRKNNNIGYTIDNCVTCCKTCNYFKMKLSVGDFLDHIRKIYEFTFVENRR